MKPTTVVDHEAWLTARIALLAQEKEFSRLREDLAAARRELPWEAVRNDYTFTGADGTRTLVELFGAHDQLVVYHFMFADEWDAGCPHCSFWADSFDGIPVHLAARGISFVAVSRAPYDKLAAYQERMGWSFPWYSSSGATFNDDFGVGFSDEALADGSAVYNYVREPGMSEREGISAFARDGASVFHTYSTYARGIDAVNSAYQFIDLTAKGRDEGGHDGPQFWVRRHDEY